jgi:hypothetical protein
MYVGLSPRIVAFAQPFRRVPLSRNARRSTIDLM